jgi:WD40 repeat protein
MSGAWRDFALERGKGARVGVRFKLAGDGMPFACFIYRLNTTPSKSGAHAMQANSRAGFTRFLLVVFGSAVDVAVMSLLPGVAATPAMHRFRPPGEPPLPKHALLRLGTTRFHAPGTIHALAFSPDGTMLAAGGREGYVQLFDACTGQRLHRLEMPGWYIQAVAFSADGKRLAGYSYSNPGKLAIWDIEKGKRLAVSPDRVSSLYPDLAFTPDGEKVVISAWNLELRSTFTAEVVRRVPEKKLDFCSAGLALAPDGKTVAVGGHPESFLVDLVSGEIVRRIEGESGYGVRAVAFTPDGKVLALGANGCLKLVNVTSGATLATARVDETGNKLSEIQYLAFANGGKVLVSRSDDGAVRLWDWTSLKPECRRLLDDIHVAAVSSDGTTLATVVGKTTRVGNQLRLWDLATGKEKTPREPGHPRGVTSLAFAPNGDALATGDAYQTCLWRLPTGALQHTIAGSSKRLIPSYDGKSLAITEHGGKSCFVDVASGRERALAAGKGTYRNPLGFIKEGQHFLTGTWAKESLEMVVACWDTATGRLLKQSHVGPYYPQGACLTPDGKALICLGVEDRRLQVVDLRTCRQRQELTTWFSDGNEIMFSDFATRAGLVLASGKFMKVLENRRLEHSGFRGWSYHDGITVWELDSGHLVRLPVSAGLAALSPDGRLLATTEDGGGTTPDRPTPIRLWDIATGREVLCLEPADTYVASLEFSPDGLYLASGLDDGTTILWDIAPAWQAARKHGPPPTAAELNALWKALASPDPAQAFAAMGKLAAAPAETVALLRQRLVPVPRSRQEQVEALVAQLDSPKFAQREEAMRQLAALRGAFEDVLWQALEANPPLEVRFRLNAMLSQLLPELSPDALQQLRAIRLLEWIGSRAAQRLLADLAGGANGARETRAAMMALGRLATMKGP